MKTLERFRKEFDTSLLLSAVDSLHEVRRILALDPDFYELRDQLLDLYKLASDVVNGEAHNTDDLLEIARQIDDQTYSISQQVDNIRESIVALIDHCPDDEELGDDDLRY